jgi:RNA polymerase sigma factor (sigma-70 family)
MEDDACDQSSIDLLAAVLRGENPAWQQLCDEVRETLKAFARSKLSPIVTPHVDASDVVQKGLAKAFERRASFRGTRLSQFYAWLKSIITNQAITENRHWIPIVSGQQAIAPGSTTGIPIPAPQAPIDLQSNIDRLLQALELLPEAQRIAVQLKKLEGWPVDRIAERLGRSKEATAGLIKRGYENLARLLMNGAPREDS